MSVNLLMLCSCREIGLVFKEKGICDILGVWVFERLEAAGKGAPTTDRKKEKRMQDAKLERALEIYFKRMPDEGADKEFLDAENYLKRRIRSVMEILLTKEDINAMAFLEQKGLFGENEVDLFIRMAKEKGKHRSLIWLLHLKDEKYGYHEKEFLL